jgi:hypothetical protein
LRGLESMEQRIGANFASRCTPESAGIATLTEL